jgi:fimbrial isopeptide formation D2 family protein/LPXTG-motif cell wall-anchored protein
MKKLNKMLSMLLAVIMVLSMSVVAMAEGTNKITISNSQTGHTYAAYQIFSGTVSGDGLTNIDWGKGIDDEANALGEAAAFAENYGEDDGSDLAKAVAPYLSSTYTSVEGNGSDADITGLEPGYYLVKDIKSLKGEDAAYTSYILQVVNDVTVSPKTSVPKLEKKVVDDYQASDSLSSADWQDSADYGLNDTVPFKLTATLADNVDDYSKYALVFHDTLSAGLTYDGDKTVSAYVVLYDTSKGYDTANEITVPVEVESAATTDTDTAYANGNDLTFTIKDLKTVEALNGKSLNKAQVVITYTATLDDAAVIGYKGNPNKAYLEYSNNPNYTVSTDEGDGSDTPKDDSSGGKDDDSTGKTPEDVVIVFTYELDVTKLNESNEKLNGATFTLYTAEEYAKKSAGSAATPVKTLNGDTTSEFNFRIIDAGDYVLEETTAPSGYNPIDPIKFTIVAGHQEEAVSPKLTSLVVNDADGNALTDFTIQAVSETDLSPSGVIATNVVNKLPGTINLPTTGGMGTRVIYLIGGALVLAASVLLVTKRRMRNSK